MVSSAALYFLNLHAAGFSDYYATAAKSMSVTWRAFAFGAFDPNATITLDKLSGFLVPQALSARIFGFTPWALALPEVIEGLVTIAVVFWIARRWLGPAGAVISAGLMAFTPLLVSMFSHPMEDSMLTMFTVLAVAAWQRALETERVRWLVLAGACVGLGFQAKMMQSWLVLPAMAIVYFLASTRSRRQRVLGIGALCVAAVGVSLSWMTAIGLVPAPGRPYIDGTTNNNIFSMVFGYNGLNHFVRGAFPGALPADAAPASTGSGTSSLLVTIIDHTPIKLLFPEYASQVGWLYPLVAAGVVLGVRQLMEWRRQKSTGSRPVPEPEGHLHTRVAVQFSTALLVTLVVVMGAIGLPHSAYLASLAFPLAVLSALGAILLWRAFRTPASRWRFALPITIAAETAWTVWLLTTYPTFARWIVAPVAVVGIGCAIALAASARGRVDLTRIVIPMLALAGAAAIAAPVIWSLSTLNPAYAGTANDAHAGPLSASAFNPPLKPAASYGTGLNSNRVRPYTATLEDAAYDYAAQRSSRLQFVLALDSWRSASPMIMDGASRLLPVGGYSSRAPSATPSEIAALVHRGSLRFVLLTGAAAKNSAQSTPIMAFHSWTLSHCSVVPLSTFDSEGYPSISGVPDSLFDCGRTPSPSASRMALRRSL